MRCFFNLRETIPLRTIPQAVADFERLDNGDENSFEILQKYEVDSDHYMEFDTIADYVIDEDADGFYLFERVGE